MINLSWYVNFYVAYQTSDGMIYPYGPFDYSGDYKCIHWTSRSFTTDLKDSFDTVKKEQVSKELIDAIYNSEIDDDYELSMYWGICPLENLPSGDFIKSNYYLIDDIEKYQKDKHAEDLFYDSLDPITYNLKSQNELKFGKPTETTDEWGDKYTPYSCADYAFFTYADYDCKEYEAHKIRIIVYSMYDSYKESIPKDAKIVIFKTEG